MRLLIVGPQGAGKGTQATLLAGNLGIPHVSTGDLFRDNVSRGTELGKRVQQFLDAGDLVPDEVTSDMVAARIAEADAEGGFLLDGFPRSLSQSEWLSNLFAERGIELDAVILLTAPDDVVVGRMLARGRADDTDAAIRRRLDIYHTETTPLIDYYGDKIVTVDGVGAVEEVQQRILSALSADSHS